MTSSILNAVNATRLLLSAAVLACCFNGGAVFADTIVSDSFDDGDVTDGVDPLDVAWAPYKGTTLTVQNDDGAGLLNGGNAMLIDRDNNNVTGAIADLPGGSLKLINVGDFIKLEFDFRYIGNIPFETNVTNRGFRAGFFRTKGTPDDVNDDQGYFFQAGVGDPTFFPAALELGMKQEVGGQANGPANGSDHASSLAGTGTMLNAIDDTLPRSLAFTLTKTALGVLAAVELDGDGNVVSDEYYLGSHLGKVVDPNPPSGQQQPSIDLDLFEYFGIFAAKKSYDLIVDNVRVTTNVPEPSSFVLIALGLAAIGLFRRR